MSLDECAGLSSSYLGSLTQMNEVLAQVSAVLIDCHRAVGTLRGSSGSGLQRLGQELSLSNRHLGSVMPVVRAL